MAPDPTAGGRSVGRRDMLRLGVGAAVLSLTGGCGIRLEGDPSLATPGRTPVPDEAVLTDAMTRTTELAQTAGRVPSPPAAVTALADLHRTQGTVLRARLVSAGVPGDVLDPPSMTRGAGTVPPAVSAPPPATPDQLRDGEQGLVAALLPRLPSVTRANRALVSSVVSACAAAAEVLGGTIAWPAADPLPPAAAVPLLEETRAAGYAFQVVAAQTSAETRTRALATHTELATREAEVAAMAGPNAPPAPLGYALPFPVTTPDAAVRLATHVLTALVAEGLAPIASVPDGSTATATLVRLLAGAQRLGREWGVALLPFPGQVYP